VAAAFVAVTWSLYATSTLGRPSVSSNQTGSGWRLFKVKVSDAFAIPAELKAFTVKLNVCDAPAVGVPAITPVFVLRVNPAGSTEVPPTNSYGLVSLIPVAGYYVAGTGSLDLSLVRELGNSILGGGSKKINEQIYPDGPDVLTIIVTNVGASTSQILGRISWTEAQA